MILVSGQSGFIGQRIGKYLDTIAIPRLHYLDSYRKLFINLQPKIIIHLAAYGNHYHQTDFYEMVKANITNTYNILEAASLFDYDKFYNISTSSVGLSKQTFYSITKQCGENIAKMYKNTINVHPYSVYGEGEASHRFIPTVIRHLKSGEVMKLDEHACHDWIYVDDFIEAMLNGYTEVGTGISTTNIEIVRMLEEISGLKLSYQPALLRVYDTKDWVCPDGVPFKIDLLTGLKKVYDSIK